MSKIFQISIIGILLLSSCQNPLPENIDSTFTDWLINPGAEKKKLLLSYKLSAEVLDSLAATVKSREIKTGKFSCNLFDQDGTEHILGFATPDIIAENTLYPLIVYLHGGIGTPRNDKGEHAYEMFRFLADTIDIFLASPSGNRTAHWWSRKGLERILQTVRYMTLHFPIDPKRIFLAGVSDGATGCYAAANAAQGPFAGFIAISGHGGMLKRLGIELHPSNLMQRPIYNINAGKDRLYNPQAVNQFLDWLEQNGVLLKRKFYHNEEHGFEYREKEKTTLAEIINTWYKPDRENISWIVVNNVSNYADNLLNWKICGNKPQARILAYWQEDTLNVKVNGICSFTMVSDRKAKGKLFYKTAKGEVEILEPVKLNTSLYLDLMQHICYPKIAGKVLFQIENK